MLALKTKSISAPSGNCTKLNMDCSGHQMSLSTSQFQTTFTNRKLVPNVAKILNVQLCFDFSSTLVKKIKKIIMISGNTAGKMKQQIF